MRRIKKLIILTFAIILTLLSVAAFSTEAMAKTSTVTIDLTEDNKPVKCPAKLKSAKNVKITISKKSVVKVKYLKSNNDKRIQFTGKKAGSAKVSVKCYLKGGKTKTYKYTVKVKKGKKKTDKELAKEAFKIQNEYRAEDDVAALEWSDELYEFCLYRLKTSGYDHHENKGRDMYDFFGGYAHYSEMQLGENLYRGSREPERAMKGWKSSEGHYANLMSPEHKCGAIAVYGNMWCASFYDGDLSEIENWRSFKICTVTVKRFDTSTNTFLDNCEFAYYESGNKEATLVVARIKETAGKTVYLEPGKTYIFYERKAPDGLSKAEQVTYTAVEGDGNEIILQ